MTDSVTIGDRLTVNVGVRFDHARSISQDIPAVGFNGRETGDIIRGLGTLFTWSVASPRLGVTTKLTGNGRTVLRASYGRFHQGVLTGEGSQSHRGLNPTTTMQFDPATGGYTSFVSIIDPQINVRVDPHMRSPKTDEYSIGVDRELAGRLSASIAYIHKSGSDYIGWTDVGGQYTQDTRVLPDGRIIPVSVLVNAPADRRFLVTNPDGYFVRYNGLVIAAEKRPFKGWQVFGSYTYSKTYGLQSNLDQVPRAPRKTSSIYPSSTTSLLTKCLNAAPKIFGVCPKVVAVGAICVNARVRIYAGGDQ